MDSGKPKISKLVVSYVCEDGVYTRVVSSVHGSDGVIAMTLPGTTTGQFWLRHELLSFILDQIREHQPAEVHVETRGKSVQVSQKTVREIISGVVDDQQLLVGQKLARSVWGSGTP